MRPIDFHAEPEAVTTVEEVFVEQWVAGTGKNDPFDVQQCVARLHVQIARQLAVTEHGFQIHPGGCDGDAAVVLDDIKKVTLLQIRMAKPLTDMGGRVGDVESKGLVIQVPQSLDLCNPHPFAQAEAVRFVVFWN